MRHIAQHGIPDYFVRRHLPEFIAYWRERGESHHAWGARCLKHLLRQWRAEETDQFRRGQEVAMHSDWRPGQDAREGVVKHAHLRLAVSEGARADRALKSRGRGAAHRQ